MIALEWPRPLQIAAQRAGVFFRWWGRELAACVPRGLPARLGLDRAAIWITLRHDSAVVFAGGGADGAVKIGFDPENPEDQANAVREIISATGVDGPVGLLLSPEDVLRPTITLPRAASENLREVVGFEMDRHTPFRAAEVFYDFRVLRDDRQSDQMTVEVAAAPKETVERSLAVAAAWGLSVDRITVSDDAAANGIPFNLLAGTDHNSGRQPLRRLIVVEVALICVLAALAIFLPIKQKRDALAAAEAELAIVRSEAEAVGDLRNQIMALSSEMEALIAERTTRPSAVFVLDEITRILPDGTWLSELIWDESGLYIAGFSDQSSSLIALLEASPIFTAVRFNAPVTAAPQLDRERFDIALAVVGEQGE